MAEEKQKSDDASSEDKKDQESATKMATKSTAEKKTAAPSAKKNDNNVWLWIIIAVLVVGIIILLLQRGNGDISSEEKPVDDKTSEEVSTKALDFINGQLVMSGTEISVGEIAEESGLYKIPLTVAGQDITSYMTKDFTKFIPQLLEIPQEGEDDTTQNQQTQSADVQTKSDQPEVELFVMSYCPYGTQMEKGILPVLEALGDNVDVELKFVDYAMHGEKEVKENLNQYCIQKNEPQKLAPYLNCFLASTGSETDAQKCLTEVQVNTTLLNQCVAKTDAEYKVTELAKDKSTWVSGQFPQFNVDKDDVEKYGVQGSPTLVINGEVIQTGRDSASLLKTICSAFNEQPEACQTELSSTPPSPGFGTGTDQSGASTDADCGA